MVAGVFIRPPGRPRNPREAKHFVIVKAAVTTMCPRLGLALSVSHISLRFRAYGFDYRRQVTCCCIGLTNVLRETVQPSRSTDAESVMSTPAQLPYFSAGARGSVAKQGAGLAQGPGDA